MKFNLILAADAKHGIGLKGKLPWPHNKDDLAHLRRMTKGKSDENNAEVMGCNTWFSLPRARRHLDDRANFVLTRVPKTAAQIKKESGRDATVVSSFDELLSELVSDSYCHLDTVWIIGGAQTYAQSLDHLAIQSVFLTEFKTEYVCDTYWSVREALMSRGIFYETKILHEDDKKTMYELKVKQRIIG